MTTKNEITSILPYVRSDIPVLRESLTLEAALAQLRQRGPVEGISYIYVVNNRREFQGVIPVRNLIFHSADLLVKDVMTSQKVSLRSDATVMEALNAFHSHKFLALPVVDPEGRLVGTLDITALTDTPVDLSRRQEVDQLFETIGIRWSSLKEAGLWTAFRVRFPWLVPTILSGTLCALLAGLFQATLEKSIILSFFLTLVLGLGESVSIQSLTITVARLSGQKISLKWFLQTLGRESLGAILLGGACAAAVGVLIFLWKGQLLGAASVGLTLVGSLSAASLFGLLVPSLLHALKLDPKVAAGPLVLAATDLATLAIYFGLAKLILG